MAYLGFYFNLLCHKCGIQGRIGGSGGPTPPPPPEMFRFLVESEGKEVESKRKKK